MMFEIPVQAILDNPIGFRVSDSFEGDVLPGEIQNIEFLAPLKMNLEFVNEAEGIRVILSNIKTSLEYNDMNHRINIPQAQTVYSDLPDPLCPDQLSVNPNTLTLDLAPFLSKILSEAIK